MPGRRLSILAAISLAMLLVLVWGYFARLGPVVQRVRIAGNTSSMRGFYIFLDRGCCEVATFQWTGRAADFPTLRPDFGFYFVHLRARPTMHESLWGFHIINDSMYRGLRFPIW